MKYSIILACLLAANTVFAQDKAAECYDVVSLKGGSVLRGEILEYNAGGDLIMKSWNGAKMQLPAINVKRITQHCKGAKNERASLANRPYSFKEQGWYHATRAAILPGESGVGLGIQHSSGFKLNRYMGLGLGVGVENFHPYDDNVATYPVFAELRGYLSPRHISPFYALGLGYGISGNRNQKIGFNEQWKGGWMLQGHIGYRIGNHFIIQLGIRMQRKTRSWEDFNWNQFSGVDKILYKRMDIGFGLLL